METLIIHSQQTENYEIKTKTYQGKKHLVVPVVMMVEGVHNGSHGKIFHKAEELGKFIESWNGIPIVIQHPEKDGKFISANSPEVLELQKVGRTFNTRLENKKLIADAWLEEEKLKETSMKAYKAIKKYEPLDVSTGIFNDEIEEIGSYSGEDYEAIASNYRPDHLALLPGGQGACSWADGCGIRANSINMDTKKMIQSLQSSGFIVSEIVNNMGEAFQGFKERIDSLSSKLREKNKQGTYCYLEEVYPGHIVYSESGEMGSKLYKQNYQVNTSGVVELTGDPVEVHKKVEYINSNKKEVKIMSNAKDCPKCLEKVNALLANKSGKWTETDREWLLAQDETVLDKLVPEVIEKTVEVNKLSASDQADLAWARKQREEKRTSLIRDIQVNAKDVWTEDELKAMSEATLEKVLSSTGKVDHSLNGHTINANAGEITALGGPEMAETKK